MPPIVLNTPDTTPVYATASTTTERLDRPTPRWRLPRGSESGSGRRGHARSSSHAPTRSELVHLRRAGGAHRRVGGLSRVTQPVFGALGVVRKEASTRCAQRDL